MCNKAERLSGAAPSCLPEDIIVEILSWLPVVSLVRLKCICDCKTWRHMIEGDDELREMHRNRATTCFRYQHKHMPETTFSSRYKKKKKKIEVFCCIDTQKGLVLEQDRGTELTERLRIRNPATRQVIYLPVVGGTYWMLAGMFFVGKSCCKVISFWQDGNSILEGQFRAITVGDDDAAWRPLNNSHDHDHDLLHQIGSLFNRRPKIYALSIENVFHVVTMDNEPKKIISVDSENERIKSREIPETLFSDWSNVKPREWDSKLSLYTQDGENNINIWVLQNHDEEEWAKTTIVVDYPVPFIAEDAKFYIEIPHSYFWWLRSRFIRLLNQNEDAVVVIKPTILHLKGMEAMPQEAIDDRPYWKEEDFVGLIPSSQIISLLPLLLFKDPP